MKGLFDSHSHLQDAAFEGDSDAVVERARDAGLEGLIVLGYDLDSSHAAVALSRRHPGFVFAAAGIHPHDALGAGKDVRDELAALASTEDVVAVGETGLDFFRNLSPAEDQLELLGFHLDLALHLGKPVSVHSRAAEDVIEAPLEGFATQWRRLWPGRKPGVMHCFGGSPAQARRFIDLGFFISVACVVTYPSADSTRELATAVPLESLLIETDSPYLPPQHSRGRRNEPANVADACAAIAELRGAPVDEVARATSANALALCGITAGHHPVTVSQ